MKSKEKAQRNEGRSGKEDPASQNLTEEKELAKANFLKKTADEAFPIIMWLT